MPVPRGYRRKKIASKRGCARGSFRRIRSGKALLTVCCPKGKYRKGRCRVGTHAISVDKPRR